MTTTQTGPQQIAPKPPPKKPKGLFRRHLFLWFFLAVQALFIAWLVVGISGNAGIMTHGSEAAQAGAEIGTTIGAGLIFGVWVGVDVILGVGRLIVVTSRRRRE